MNMLSVDRPSAARVRRTRRAPLATAGIASCLLLASLLGSAPAHADDQGDGGGEQEFGVADFSNSTWTEAETEATTEEAYNDGEEAVDSFCPDDPDVQCDYGPNDTVTYKSYYAQWTWQGKLKTELSINVGGVFGIGSKPGVVVKAGEPIAGVSASMKYKVRFTNGRADRICQVEQLSVRRFAVVALTQSLGVWVPEPAWKVVGYSDPVGANINGTKTTCGTTWLGGIQTTLGAKGKASASIGPIPAGAEVDYPGLWRLDGSVRLGLGYANKNPQYTSIDPAPASVG